MLAATFVGVTLACFAGEITCNELKQLGQYIQNCNDNEFHEVILVKTHFRLRPKSTTPRTTKNTNTKFEFKATINEAHCF
ncbi:unnamed protein product [Ixodes pacificus]